MKLSFEQANYSLQKVKHLFEGVFFNKQLHFKRPWKSFWTVSAACLYASFVEKDATWLNYFEQRVALLAKKKYISYMYIYIYITSRNKKKGIPPLENKTNQASLPENPQKNLEKIRKNRHQNSGTLPWTPLLQRVWKYCCCVFVYL